MIKRGEIYLVDLAGSEGAEQGGIRPAIIVQNDKGNQFSPTTIIFPITSKYKKQIPTHVTLDSNDNGIEVDSIILGEQPRTVDKKRLLKRLGSVKNQRTIDEINEKIRVSFGI